MRVAEKREQRRQHEVLLAGLDREDPRQVRTDGNEAHVPERDDARVADEDIEGDDDRGVDERVLELELPRRREIVPDPPDRDDEQDRRRDLKEWVDPSHTRSTGARRPGANRPLGRSSNTRITIPKTTDGRY